MPEQQQQQKNLDGYVPCEHIFHRIVKTSKGDVQNCSKCGWTFYQTHGQVKDQTVSMGRLLEATP